MINRLMVLAYIHGHPGRSTREAIATLATKHRVTKQKICGYLSYLRRSKQIDIITLVPRHLSVAV